MCIDNNRTCDNETTGWHIEMGSERILIFGTLIDYSPVEKFQNWGFLQKYSVDVLVCII